MRTMKSMKDKVKARRPQLKDEPQPEVTIGNFEIIKGPVTIDGFLYKGVSTLYKLHGRFVILTAIDEKELHSICRDFELDCDPKKFKTVAGSFEWIQKKDDDVEKFWYFNEAANVIFLDRKFNTREMENIFRLAKAERKTEAEARLALRKKYDFTNEELKKIKVCFDDDVPF